VRKLGITKPPESKQKMLYLVHGQLEPLLETEKLSTAVQDSMREIIKDIKHHIDHMVPHAHGHDDEAGHASEGSESPKAALTPDAKSVRASSATKLDLSMKEIANKYNRPPRCSDEICEQLLHAKESYNKVVSSQHMKMMDMPELPCASREEGMMDYIREHDSDVNIVKATNEAFLSMLTAQYWRQLDAGEFVQGNSEVEQLIRSVSLSRTQAGHHLGDWEQVLQCLTRSHENNQTESEDLKTLLDEEHDLHRETGVATHMRAAASTASESTVSRVRKSLVDLPGILAKNKREKHNSTINFIEGAVFSLSISIVLILNSLFIYVEQTRRSGDNYHHAVWVVMEIIFTVIFFFEFVLKIVGYRCYYWIDSWNLFDFFLLVLSLFGIIMEFVASGADDGQNASKEARLFRLNRLFRVLRILRLIRLFRFIAILKAMWAKEDISFQLREHMKTITICRAFVKAHTQAQEELIRFFGKEGNYSNSEQMRCVLDSQTEIYKALVVAAMEASSVDGKTLIAMNFLRDNICVASKIRHFILEALELGVIGSREAETITHPLDDQVRSLMDQMKHAASGRVHIEPDKDAVESTKERRPSDDNIPAAMPSGCTSAISGRPGTPLGIESPPSSTPVMEASSDDKMEVVGISASP